MCGPDAAYGFLGTETVSNGGEGHRLQWEALYRANVWLIYLEYE